MIRIWIVMFALGVFITGVTGQQHCDIASHYKEFIHITRYEQGKRKFLSKRISKVEGQHCFTDLINDNPQYIYYLLSGFTSEDNYSTLLEITDSKLLTDSYLADISKDAQFNSIMQSLVDKTILHTQPRDSVSMETLLNVAVKFFSVVRIADDGKLVGKVCAGLYDVKRTLAQRAPFLEAFAYTAIMDNYENENYNMKQEFDKVLQQLNAVELGNDATEKLFRAQGAGFMLMFNNDALRKVLKQEFLKHKAFLPFVLKD